MRKIIISMILIGSILFSMGCQATPEENAVVNKSAGLDEKVIAEPMKSNEKIIISIPEHWKALEKRSADRVTISVDLSMDEIEVGNLPVIEMKNHSMSKDDLEKLVEYFTGEQVLYQPYIDVKQDYEREIESIKKQEGAYADPILYSSYQSDIKSLESAVELAPMVENSVKLQNIEFKKKEEDKAWQEVAFAPLTDQQKDSLIKKREQNIYFDADVGEKREAHIQAENYLNTLANSSSFKWWYGDITIDDTLVNLWMEDAQTRVDVYGTEYDLQYMKQIIPYQNFLKSVSFDSKEVLMQAEKVLKELEIKDVELSQIQKAMWFPKGAFSKSNVENLQNQIWKADLNQTEIGYEYIYTRGSGGIFADQMKGSTAGDVATSNEAYAPPFPVEKISIVVTESGLKSFLWEGMCEKVDTIAENTKLLSFEKMQEKLFDYVYYKYTMLGQPEESQTKFTYTIYDIDLGYTYIPAFQNPSNAWLIPAWFVKAEEYIDATVEGGKSYSRGTQEIMVNALDGGLIAYPVS